jgi:hypothetical protein
MVQADGHGIHRPTTCKVRQATRAFYDHAKPGRYRPFVKWETAENRTVDFRGSPDFAEWRNLVGHRFAAPPEMEHVHEVGRDFDEPKDAASVHRRDTKTSGISSD